MNSFVSRGAFFGGFVDSDSEFTPLIIILCFALLFLGKRRLWTDLCLGKAEAGCELCPLRQREVLRPLKTSVELLKLKA
jgi:hypothetical protein